MNQLSIKNYLDQHFPQFEPALKNILVENVVLKEFGIDEVLMRKGQFFKSTMLLARGLIKLYRQGEDGNEFFMYYIKPGEACALSIICAARQEASEVMAKTVEPTTVLMIPIQLMDTLMKTYTSWYYFVLDTYRQRYEELLSMIDNIAFKSMDERLEFYLKNQQKQLSTKEINLTHQQIANDLNSSREVISRLLKKMEQRGLVKLGRNTIELLH